MSDVAYVFIDPEQIEDETSRAFCVQANETARLTAETHAMVTKMFKIFQQLEPLMSALPSMPKGMAPPMMFPGMR